MPLAKVTPEMSEPEKALALAIITQAVQDYIKEQKWLLLHKDKNKFSRTYLRHAALMDSAKAFMLSQWCEYLLMLVDNNITGAGIIRALDERIADEIENNIHRKKSTWIHSDGKRLTTKSKEEKRNAQKNVQKARNHQSRTNQMLDRGRDRSGSC